MVKQALLGADVILLHRQRQGRLHGLSIHSMRLGFPFVLLLSQNKLNEEEAGRVEAGESGSGLGDRGERIFFG